MPAETRIATKLPKALGPLHFIGIGGIGMSGIARILLDQGFKVQGSDINRSDIARQLEQLGAKIYYGHAKQNVDGAAVIIVSSAIDKSNPEVRAARHLGLPVVRRAEMLAELMRLKSNVAVAGTHGKTTTTTLVAALLDEGGLDPTVVNGGIISNFGSNARTGGGEWMVVEADESDGSFVTLPATIAVVTNIDPEHLDHYRSYEHLCHAFDAFVSNIPFYGFAICCSDHPEVRNLIARLEGRQMVTYGFNSDADFSVSNIQYVDRMARFDIELQADGRKLENCRLPLPGRHNLSNALAATAVAVRLGVTDEAIRKSLQGFSGVNRRYTRLGKVCGAEIIDDYAHHPVEIAHTLEAARSETAGRVIAIHQPHRYSRLASLFEDFCNCFDSADLVAITEIYAAGETKVEGVSQSSLVDALSRRGHHHVCAVDGVDGIRSLINREAKPGDTVVAMGAGSITGWIRAAVAELTELES